MKLSVSVALLLLPLVAAAEQAALPGYLLRLPASIDTVLVAETDSAILRRYRSTEHGVTLDDEWPMSVGQNGAGKQKSGDRRTPLGVYFVVEELDTTLLHEKYGPVAFPLDYPNVWDKRMARTGHGIWVHGVTPGSGPRPARDTDGCIALANESLLLLADHMEPLVTPVIITRKIDWSTDAEIDSLRAQLAAAVGAWAESYRRGDWSTYLTLYADEFEYRGMSRAEWSQYRLQTSATRAIDSFAVAELLLLADPTEAGLYVSRFEQTITTAGQATTTVKRLYWRETSSGVFRIVAEDNG